MRKAFIIIGLNLIFLSWMNSARAQNYTEIFWEETVFESGLYPGKSNYFRLRNGSLAPSISDPAPQINLYDIIGNDTILIPDIRLIYEKIYGGPGFIGGIDIIIQLALNAQNGGIPDSLLLEVRKGNKFYYRPNITFKLLEDKSTIWGGETTEGDFNGGMNGWSVNAISDPDALWVWEPDSKADLGAFSKNSGDLGILSPSVADGAMVFDSDFYDNNGNQNNPGGGIAPAPQTSELISPIIDISGITFQPVVQFHQYFRQYQSTTSLFFSTDGGATWSAPVNLNTDIDVNKATARFDVKSIPVVGFLPTNEFRIKFRINGNYYFWIIDDVRILVDSSVSLLPAVPNLVSPVNGATDESVNISLTWVPVVNAVSYYAQVDTTINFSSPLLFTDTILGNNAPALQLMHNTTYHWRVKAANLVGQSDWSEIWSFTTTTMTAIQEAKSVSEIKVYPNPADASVLLEFDSPASAETQLAIYNSVGKLTLLSMQTIEKGMNSLYLNTQDFPAGMYHFQILVNEIKFAGKFIVE